MNIKLRNKNGVLTECKVGFSWTNLFFGFLTPLFRADIKWAIIQFIAAIISYSVSLWIFPFFYNKIYIKGLLNKGYYPATEIDEEILISKGFIVANNNEKKNINNILEDANKSDNIVQINNNELEKNYSIEENLINDEVEKNDSIVNKETNEDIINNEKELYSISDNIINDVLDTDEENI